MVGKFRSSCYSGEGARGVESEPLATSGCCCRPLTSIFTSNAVHLGTVDPGELAFEIFPRPEPPRRDSPPPLLGLFAQYGTHVKPEEVEARVENSVTQVLTHRFVSARRSLRRLRPRRPAKPASGAFKFPRSFSLSAERFSEAHLHR